MKNDLSPSSSCFRKTDMSILSLLLFHGPSVGRGPGQYALGASIKCMSASDEGSALCRTRSYGP